MFLFLHHHLFLRTQRRERQEDGKGDYLFLKNICGKELRKNGGCSRRHVPGPQSTASLPQRQLEIELPRRQHLDPMLCLYFFAEILIKKWIKFYGWLCRSERRDERETVQNEREERETDEWICISEVTKLIRTFLKWKYRGKLGNLRKDGLMPNIKKMLSLTLFYI